MLGCSLSNKHLARILSIDYGKKRTGIAVTDPLQIIAGGLATVSTSELFDWLKAYLAKEAVERIIIGEPRHSINCPDVPSRRPSRSAPRRSSKRPVTEQERSQDATWVC